MRVAPVHIALVVLPGCAGAPVEHVRDPETGWIVHQAEHPSPSAAYRWLHITQEAAGRSVDRVGARPTIISREMAMAMTAAYDAWAAYDDKAVGTRLGESLRRPEAERTLENKEEAIAYAAYRALLYAYPEDAAWLAEQMRADGYDPDGASTDTSTPQGVGNVAAAAVIEYRRNDGANQHGDMPGCNGQPYSDYTGYEPVNPPDEIRDPDRWQPLPFRDEDGETYYPGYLTPHWHLVKPLGLERADMFRPGPPPKYGSEELKRQVDEIIAMNGNLTLEQKAEVEFMRDGPRSTGQSGHWLRFAADVARRDNYDVNQEVKLYFCVANIVLDTFISCWEAKRFYDSSRPWTLIRHYYADDPIVGYLGPGKGFGTIPAMQWHPYSPATFVTPPFPGYTSGHATASGGAGRMLALFTGSDRYEAVALCRAGELTEAESRAAWMQAREGVPADLPDNAVNVRLLLPTFSATSQMAARSRALGGYHISADNDVGHAKGIEIADYCWPRYRAYFEGTASVRG